MSINLELKNKIKKNIRKYMTVVCSLLLLPLFSINSYADSNTYPQYIYTLPFAYSQHYSNNGTVSSNRNFTKGDDYNYHLTHNATVWDTAFEFFMYIPNTTETDYIYSFPVNSDVYDYYVFHSFTVDNIDNNTVITGYDFGYYDENNNFIVNNVVTDRIDKELIYRSNVTGTNSKSRSYQYTGKLNLNFNGTYNLGVLRYYGNGSLYNQDTYLWSLCVIALPKGDIDAYNDIVNAINNQTTSLGGKLDGIDSGIDKGNDLIENGNSGTQSVIDDFNQVFDDFNQELENIEEFDSQIIGEFESANEQYMTELNNFSLSASLLNAGNWLSTSMQTVYDNSSDYKMLWLVPLLLGIPLLILFIRKGDNNE